MSINLGFNIKRNFPFLFKGNLQFTDVDGEHCSITRSNDNNDQLKWISKLLSCQEADISSTLTSRVVAARNEVIQARQNMTRAYYGRDALSKVSLTELKKKTNILT